MADSTVSADDPEPVFRANKRRKVFRRRDDSGERDPTAHSRARDTNVSESEPPSEHGEGGLVPIQKPRAARKRIGVGFSSTEKSGKGGASREDAMALMPAPTATPDMAHNERFVRQTGRVGVIEDKHMLAFVDQQMAQRRALDAAEFAADERPSTAPSLNSSDSHEAEERAPGVGAATRHTAPVPGSTQVEVSHGGQSIQPIHTRPVKRRGQRAGPTATDLARDNLVDQIMHEAETATPIYERATATPVQAASTGDVDNDSAAAEAFKAQLLADLQQNRRRRAPPPAAKPGEKLSSGPKLGGSRSQREKMRAIEEAKGPSGVKK